MIFVAYYYSDGSRGLSRKIKQYSKIQEFYEEKRIKIYEKNLKKMRMFARQIEKPIIY